MAVSKIWKVTVRLDQVIDYATNPEKTAAKEYSPEQYQALADVLQYAKDEEKTEREFYVGGINCNVATARDQFVTVKEQFDKCDGIQAYHGYLSFKDEPNITPELAQQIGTEFAKRVWGDRFQVVVTTHLNTKHLHCHFVVNSVSFVDGKRMDDSKKQLLKDIFWEMNSISSRTESKSETVITETDDGNGNIVQTETTVTRTYLYITVSHKTVDEMTVQYGFNQEQKDYLTELLQDKNNSLWSSVLYGITASDDQIVTVALSQIGNVGGEPYWSWYGFGSRVEWCACFVSWCANECGYIDTGVIPKFAGCVNGVQWFKDRGQWMDGSAEPVAGMIIFFDWDNKGSSGPQDGLSDHVGIVQKVENGIVYTVEGNSGDSVRVNQYSVGHYEILGYGVLCV